jgi:hypothetical protein
MPHAQTPTIAIRAATSDDARTLTRLAALDSAAVPDGPVLLAEVDGQARAAIALRDGRVVADPFERTAGLTTLLRMQAENVAGERREHRPDVGRRLRLAA